VERYHGIAEKIISFAIESVVVAGRTAKDGIEGTALYIDSHIEAPIVDASAIFPTVGGPRLVTGFAGLRNRVKLPDFFARPSVIGARLSRQCDPQVFRDVLGAMRLLSGSRWLTIVVRGDV